MKINDDKTPGYVPNVEPAQDRDLLKKVVNTLCSYFLAQTKRSL